jgi:hypothetical protein
MKPSVFLLLSAALLLTACATHYWRVENQETLLFLRAPRAREVLFASSLDQFAWRRARRTGEQLWQVAIPRDIPQTYVYRVDGELFVPDCRFKEQDDFGSENCLYIPGM